MCICLGWGQCASPQMVVHISSAYKNGDCKKMDKNTLINYHRILVFIRYDIKRRVNEKIVDLLLSSLHEHINNSDFVVEMHKMMMTKGIRYIFMTNDESFNLLISDTDDNAVVEREDAIRNILLYSMTKIKMLLKIKAYDEAYDIIDAIHALPEIFANGRVTNLFDYWKIYIEPVRLTWGREYFTEVSRYFV